MTKYKAQITRVNASREILKMRNQSESIATVRTPKASRRGALMMPVASAIMLARLLSAPASSSLSLYSFSIIWYIPASP
eukprot:CAMPEP_0119343088 /NCGR_PEP_ID=MMETSP1333-20130426/106092_1 /TAXON_ID=418940 /ORGANISM="Scyphosphaera apsteinii, Strain RCC1455" /LENGTH=78 /DNA_ID=CAMNT_0007355439 /DNA_START=874 /DNA_END=1107 /DNA_ORIENTATION=+